MIGAKFRTLPSLTWAAFLIVAALAVGWVAIKTTVVALLPSLGASAAPLLAGDSEFVLHMAMRDYAAHQASLSPQALPAIRRAAASLPLDDRPYLLIGSDDLRRGQAAHAVQVLEAGRRLNPRQRWTHVLLLQLYLRTGRYAASAEELAVLARLVGPAQSLIATALAQMSVAPETRDAVQKTLRRDLPLERSVLTALASTDIEPSIIFAMASPAALSKANAPGAWGTVLVDRMVKNQRYRSALAVWQRINRVTGGTARPLLYDAELRNLPGSPPFNWALESGNIGAADLRNNALQINYYGRDAGDLAKQLLVLAPGAYRFSQIVSGSQQAAASTLTWSMECANAPERQLLRMPVSSDTSGRRRVAATLTVPDGCPAQMLHLTGSPGEFPAPVSLTVDHLQLERLGGS